MATTVIIPARNEEVTIGDIVRVFNSHPETANQVYVAIDGATVDRTAERVLDAGGVPVPYGYANIRGKGQIVAALTHALTRANAISDRVILCDADYTGMNSFHVDRILTKYRAGMVVGVPDWPEIDIPQHVIHAWPRVSGFRCLPRWLIPDNAHGYMLETQLNIRAIKARMPIPFVQMNGLKSPFQWPLSPDRQLESDRDREWGKAYGIL